MAPNTRLLGPNQLGALAVALKTDTWAIGASKRVMASLDERGLIVRSHGGYRITYGGMEAFRVAMKGGAKVITPKSLVLGGSDAR